MHTYVITTLKIVHFGMGSLLFVNCINNKLEKSQNKGKNKEAGKCLVNSIDYHSNNNNNYYFGVLNKIGARRAGSRL